MSVDVSVSRVERAWQVLDGHPTDQQLGQAVVRQGLEVVARRLDEERPDPYGIDAVLALAPVDFTRATINEVA